MKFKEQITDDKILEGLQRLGYEDMMPIQEKMLSYIRNHRDIMAQAKTGSGKTAAFAVPLIEAITWEEMHPQVLILAPVRELALQISDEFESIGLYKKIKVCTLLGRQPYQGQSAKLAQRVHAVIGTPGRVLDHMERGTLHCDNMKTIVLDEADQMLNMGFITQIKDILSHIETKHNTLLFSATMPEEIQSLAREFMQDPEYVTLDEEENKVNVKHEYFILHREEKSEFLKKLLIIRHVESAVLFVSTHERADEVYGYLWEEGVSCDMLHGGMMQKERFEVMENFRKGKIRYLVATDVAARGIDVDELSHVIHVDLPNNAQTYVHRIGRCGRKDASGTSIVLCEKSTLPWLEKITGEYGIKVIECDSAEIRRTKITEKQSEFITTSRIRRTTKKEKAREDVMRLYVNGGKKKKIRAGDLVGAICEIEGITADDIGTIEIRDNGSFFDILHGRGKLVLKEMQKKTIKGKKLRVERAAGNKNQ